MEFPAFLFGGEETVIERAETEGAAWLAAWRKTGALPSNALRAIAPGELVIVHHGSLDPFARRWRLCGAEFAMSSALHGLDEVERAAFAELVRGTPWGALGECVRLRPPNTVESVTRRARSLLAMWEPLATLRYIGMPRSLPAVVTFPALNQDSISFDELVGELFEGPLAVWGPQIGAVRLRLEHALDMMAAASPGEAQTHVLARMTMLARENRRTRGTAADDRSTLAAWLEKLPAEKRAALVPCVTPDLLGELYAMARDRAYLN